MCSQLQWFTDRYFVFRCSQLRWFTDRCIVLGAAIRTSALLQIATLTDNILQKTARQSVINVLNAELSEEVLAGTEISWDAGSGGAYT